MTCSQAIKFSVLFCLIILLALSNETFSQDKTSDQKKEAQTQQATQDKTTQKPKKKPEPSKSAAVRQLFNGKDLTGWRKIDDSYFEESGDVKVVDGEIELGKGNAGTGIIVQDGNKKSLLKMNYLIDLDAKRVEGSDFFCGLTFPVKDEFLTLIVGGWGGQVCGISNLGGFSAIDNETTHVAEFKNKVWYHIKIKVTPGKIESWIDDEKIVDVDISDKKLSIRWEMEPVRPLGISTWYTKARLRNITVTDLTKLPSKPKKQKEK